MGEKTEISWADSTFNPWIGCQKVSAGCDNCYAETLMDKRYHKVEWGPHGERKRTSAANWRQPITWNKHHAAFQAKHGHRQRVFCASLADVFDNQVPPLWRVDLIDLIVATPNLDWLLLTKRPENIWKMLAQYGIPENVWLGTTCEDQAAYDRRWPILRGVPARVRFISYEPAIGPLTLTGFEEQPDWLIAGGESGQGHRSASPRWFYAIKYECEEEGVPFFMKQMSGTKPANVPIPEDLLVRQFPL
jgi:protein gp37